MPQFSPPRREYGARAPASQAPDPDELPDTFSETLNRPQRFADRLWLSPLRRPIEGGNPPAIRRSKVLPRPVLAGGFPFPRNPGLLTYSWTIVLGVSIFLSFPLQLLVSFHPLPPLFSPVCGACTHPLG